MGSIQADMDIDALATARAADWRRLGELAKYRRLDGAASDELIERYQLAASDLSLVQSTAGSTAMGDRLSLLLARARLRFAGAPENSLRVFLRFWWVTVPVALYRIRWLTLALAVVTAIIAVLFGWWYATDPAVFRTLGTESQLRRVAESEFTAYYSESPAASFTTRVWTNNAWIAAQCIAFGILGVWVPYLLLMNAMNLGTSWSIMAHFGKSDTFFLYIAPHGLLELTCIFVSAAAGINIFWAWIAPGARTRSVALAEAGRVLFSVAVGTAFFLLLSGLVEGLVTPSDLPWPIKIGIGALALCVYLAATFVLGRRAYRSGETGDLSVADGGVRQLAAG